MICDNSTILKVMNIIKIVLLIFRITVPILLIVIGTKNYMLSIKDSDELSKANKKFVVMLVSAVCIFMIPTFVSIICRLTGNIETYESCFVYATKDRINVAEAKEASRYVEKLKNTLNNSDFNIAYKEVNKLNDSEEKNKLIDELYTIEKYIDINNSINSLKNKYDSNLYDEIESKIQSIEDDEYKDILIEKLDSIEKGGTRLNIESGFYKTKVNNSKVLEYTLYIPKNATTNMPLYVILPAHQSTYNIIVKETMNIKYLENVPFFIYIPKINTQEYNSSHYPSIYETMLEIINKYQIDKTRLSATGASSSGTWVYHFVYKYKNEFAAMVPMSSGVSVSYVDKDYNYWKNLPMKGFGEKGPLSYDSNGKACCPSCETGSPIGWNPSHEMSNLFEHLGKSSDFIDLGKTCHGDVPNVVYSIDNNSNQIPDIFEWLEKQHLQ